MKKKDLLSRIGVPGWEIGTTGVSQPGQINIFVVVITIPDRFVLSHHELKNFIFLQTPLL